MPLKSSSGEGWVEENRNCMKCAFIKSSSKRDDEEPSKLWAFLLLQHVFVGLASFPSGSLGATGFLGSISLGPLWLSPGPFRVAMCCTWGLIHQLREESHRKPIRILYKLNIMRPQQHHILHITRVVWYFSSVPRKPNRTVSAQPCSPCSSCSASAGSSACHALKTSPISLPLGVLPDLLLLWCPVLQQPGNHWDSTFLLMETLTVGGHNLVLPSRLQLFTFKPSAAGIPKPAHLGCDVKQLGYPDMPCNMPTPAKQIHRPGMARCPVLLVRVTLCTNTQTVLMIQKFALQLAL